MPRRIAPILTAPILTALLAGALVAAAALAGLATAPGASAAAALALRPVVRADTPVLVAAAPGEPGRLYVVEQGGRVMVLEGGRLRAEPFLDVRARISTGGERGLLGLAFPADYATSRMVVVNYTNPAGDTRVVRYRTDGRRALPATATTLLSVRQPYPNHNGGMVAFGPDGQLYVGMGDGGAADDPEDRSQATGTLLGKILRLDARKPGSRPEIVAYGARNPWRFSFDRATGDLWIGDVGQNQIEEIDRIPAGARLPVNLGWDTFEGRSRHEDTPLGPGRLLGPVVQYTHGEGCSVTGGVVVRDGGPASLRGRYVYGDYCSGTIWSVPAAGGGAPRTARRESIEVQGLVGFGEDLAGRLYAVSNGGVVYRVE